MRTRFFTTGAALVLLLVVGCGSSGGGKGGSKVTGKVTHNGSPVAGAKVIFTDSKDNAPTPKGPSAITDESGEYTMVAVPPGTYKVIVYKFLPKPGAKLPDEGQGLDMTQMEMSKQGSHALPRKYSAAGTTNLTAAIESGENKGVDFELKGEAGK